MDANSRQAGNELFPRHGSMTGKQLEASVQSTNGASEDMVLMLEQQEELRLALLSKDRSLQELQQMVDSLGEAVQKHKREAEEQAMANKMLTLELNELQPGMPGQNGSSKGAPPSPTGGGSNRMARLNKQLEEADRAKAVAEEDAENLRNKLGRREEELRKAYTELNFLKVAQESSRTAVADLEALRQEERTMQHKMHDLQHSLLAVKQERDSLEASVQERAQQQRAEARKHQAALLEKSNEIGALRRQLAERSSTGGRILKMSIDLMVMRHAREQMEEDLKARDAEIEALRAWAAGVTAGGAGGAGPPPPPPPPPASALAPTPSSGAPGAGPGSTAGAGAAARAPVGRDPNTPEKSQGANSDAGGGAGLVSVGAGAAVSGLPPRASPSDKDRQKELEEVHSAYGEHLKLLEAEVAKLREELAGKEGELGSKLRECDEAEKARASLAVEGEGLRRQLEGLRQEVQEQQEEHALALAQPPPQPHLHPQYPKDAPSDALRFTASGDTLTVEDLQLELEGKETLVRKLQAELFDVKKRLKLSGEASGAAQRAEAERLQALWERAEAEKGALAGEVAELKSALVAAQHEREGMEAILQQAKQELNEYYAETTRTIQQYWSEGQQYKEDLRKAFEREDGLRRELRDTQMATQLQLTKLHKAKRAAAQEPAERVGVLVERVAALEGACAALERQVQEKDAAEAELRQQLTRLQRQAESHMGGGGLMRGQALVVEGLRKELGAVRAELAGEQGRAERERSARVLAEELAERRQGQVETLQAQVNNSFQEERDHLAREMEAHQQTRRELEQEREETQRQRRLVKDLEEYKNAVTNILVPDGRRPGHRLELRTRRGYNCRACRAVKHGFMWRCQDRNCQDVFCTDCLADDNLPP